MHCYAIGIALVVVVQSLDHSNKRDVMPVDSVHIIITYSLNVRLSGISLSMLGWQLQLTACRDVYNYIAVSNTVHLGCLCNR
jgi:hypothetical protein